MFAPRSPASSAFALLVLMASLCAGCRHAPSAIEARGEHDQVEVRDTLAKLITDLRLQRENTPDGPKAAWLAYEAANRQVLDAAGALDADPRDEQLAMIAARPDVTIEALEAFDKAAPQESQKLIEELEKKLGPMPPSVLAFGAARAWQPVFQGTLDGRPLTLLNARHVAFATPTARRAAIARALFRMTHEARIPDSGTMGPLAGRVFREGATSLAVRMLVPDATDQDVLELDARQLTALRGRQALIARELLAALDSANEAEVARFFSAEPRDPLLPRGTGRFISDQVFQRLATEQGAPERSLRLSPAEFVQRARRILQVMATGK